MQNGDAMKNSHPVLDLPAAPPPMVDWPSSVGLAFGSLMADLAATEPRATLQLVRIFNETAERFGSPYRLRRVVEIR